MRSRSFTGPATNAFAVTPSDNTDLDVPARSLYVGTSGDLEVYMVDDEDRENPTAVVFANVPVGIFPISVYRVLDGSTTADDIVALV